MTVINSLLQLLGITPDMEANPLAVPAPPALPGKWIIFSGAGLSKESGLATFRSKDGLWANHSIKEVCHGSTWRANRQQVFDFYEQRWQEIQSAQPHDGHAWCVEMERRGATLITQNIDTLLERAGAQRVLHVHGRIDRWQCFECEHLWQREDLAPTHCPACHSEDIRVDVVFFGERARGYRAMEHHLMSLGKNDTLVIIGTTGQVVNPLLWLQAKPRVIVVDPQPAAELTQWDRVEVKRANASQLPQHYPLDGV